MSSRRGIAGRDQGVSPFSAILGRLSDATSAVAVALVDGEGETVDYTGAITPFAVKVMAAELGIILRGLKSTAFVGLASCTEITVRARHSSFSIQALAENYALVLQLPPRAFRVSHRALAEAVREICEEAALPVPLRFRTESWTRVDVKELRNRTRRPEALWVNGSWCDVEVLGQYVSRELLPRELGFRARLANGAEMTLVRERLGLWFVES